MNNLHRQLAPISEAAWGEIDQEARRTFIRWIAGRRVVDVVGPDGEDLAAVRTGHQVRVDFPFEGVQAHQRQVRQIVELRVPFRVSRDAVDAVDRGAQDSDWPPVKDAVAQIARAEDSIVFDGLASAGIEGLVPSSSNPAGALPQPKQLFYLLLGQGPFFRRQNFRHLAQRRFFQSQLPAETFPFLLQAP